MKENTELWKKVEKTNPDYKKNVKYPFPHISIDAHYQILTATTLWGPMGKSWGVKNEQFIPIPLETENRVSIIYNAILFYPDGEIPINADIFMYVLASGKYKANNDYAKKVSTDALTKGLSKLGFSADVFMGSFDGGKYSGVDEFIESNTPKDPNMKLTEDHFKLLNKCVEMLNKNGLPKKGDGLSRLYNEDSFDSVFEDNYNIACEYLGEEVKL